MTTPSQLLSTMLISILPENAKRWVDNSDFDDTLYGSSEEEQLDRLLFGEDYDYTDLIPADILDEGDQTETLELLVRLLADWRDMIDTEPTTTDLLDAYYKRFNLTAKAL